MLDPTSNQATPALLRGVAAENQSNHHPPARQLPRPRHPYFYTECGRFRRGLGKMIITVVNVLPSILTWYALFAITGLNPLALFSSDLTSKLDPLTFFGMYYVAAAFISFNLGLIIRTLRVSWRELSWWQLCYDLECYKERNPYLDFLFGMLTWITQISIWLELQTICQGLDDEERNALSCADIASTVSFATASLVGIYGLVTSCNYNGGYYPKLPYDTVELDLIRLPSIKVGRFSIPKLWIDSDSMLSSIELMLGLVQRTMKEKDHEQSLLALKDNYDHLDWDMLDGIFEESKVNLPQLLEAFPLTSSTFKLTPKRNVPKPFRLWIFMKVAPFPCLYKGDDLYHYRDYE